MLSFSRASTLRIRRGELTDALIACPSGGPVPALNLDRPAIRACLGPDFHRPAQCSRWSAPPTCPVVLGMPHRGR